MTRPEHYIICERSPNLLYKLGPL